MKIISYFSKIIYVINKELYMIKLLFLIISLIIIGIYYWTKRQYKIRKDPLFEKFVADKANKEICLKPFSVSCDKNKIYDALSSFQDQIDELEFSMKKDNKKYDKMYEWYIQKVQRDSAVSEKANEELRNKLKAEMDKKITDATADFTKENKTKYDKENAQDLKQDTSNVNDLLLKAFEAGDADEKKDIISTVKNI